MIVVRAMTIETVYNNSLVKDGGNRGIDDGIETAHHGNSGI